MEPLRKRQRISDGPVLSCWRPELSSGEALLTAGNWCGGNAPMLLASPTSSASQESTAEIIKSTVAAGVQRRFYLNTGIYSYGGNCLC